MSDDKWDQKARDEYFGTDTKALSTDKRQPCDCPTCRWSGKTCEEYGRDADDETPEAWILENGEWRAATIAEVDKVFGVCQPMDKVLLADEARQLAEFDVAASRRKAGLEAEAKLLADKLLKDPLMNEPLWTPGMTEEALADLKEKLRARIKELLDGAAQDWFIPDRVGSKIEVLRNEEDTVTFSVNNRGAVYEYKVADGERFEAGDAVYLNDEGKACKAKGVEVGVAHSPELGPWVAAGEMALGRVEFPTDEKPYYTIVANNGQKVMTSQDGVNWTDVQEQKAQCSGYCSWGGGPCDDCDEDCLPEHSCGGCEDSGEGKKKCDCPMDVMMNQGCQCGGE